MKAMMSAACLATVCALAAGPGLNAQGQGQGQGQQQGQSQTQPQTPATQRDTQQSVTLNGCLERDTLATAAAGAARSTTNPSAGAFKLTNVTVVPSAAARTGQAGQTGQAQAGQREEDKEKTYRLNASSGVDLNEHVGHQVEVVGSIVKVSDAASAAASTAARTGQTGQAGQTGQTGQTGQKTAQQREEDKDKDGPLVMVSSVRLVANTCR